MGKCIYCRESAGFLRNSHRECKAKNDDEKLKYKISEQHIISNMEKFEINKSNLYLLERVLEREISTRSIRKIISDIEAADLLNTLAPISDIELEALSDLSNAEEKDSDSHMLESEIIKILESNKFNKEIMKNIIVTSWELSIDRAFDDGILTEEEWSNLTNLMEEFLLSKSQLDRNGAFTKILEGAALKDAGVAVPTAPIVEVLAELEKRMVVEPITLTGGDPMKSALSDPVGDFLRQLRDLPVNITVLQARGLQKKLNALAIQGRLQGFDVSHIKAVKAGLEHALNNLDVTRLPVDEGKAIIDALRKANRVGRHFGRG